MAVSRRRADRPRREQHAAQLRAVDQIMQEMQDAGFIVWTGEYRDGHKTFVATEKGIAHWEAVERGDE